MIQTGLILLLLFFYSQPYAAGINDADYEKGLLQTLQNIQNLKLDEALTESHNFVRLFPTSKVGQLLYADLLMARVGVLSHIGSGTRADPKLDDLTFELKQRLLNTRTPAFDGFIPENIIQLAENQPYAILIDQSHSRLYLYRNEMGRPVLERDFFISIGIRGFGKEKRGDQKTPIGVYHITRYIDDRELPDLYGRGAFPVNYPNAWDHLQKRTGGGIWIHGTPSHTYNRAPWSSNGCVVASNPDFSQIEQYIDSADHTPVIVAEDINWITLEQWQNIQKTMVQNISQWIGDWESLQHEAYINHYSAANFRTYRKTYKQWDQQKRWINRNKKYVNIAVNNLNIFKYPGEEDLVLMQYDQAYRSSNYDVDSAKEVFWKKQPNGWKIVFEGVRAFKSFEDKLVEN